MARNELEAIHAEIYSDVLKIKDLVASLPIKLRDTVAPHMVALIKLSGEMQSNVTAAVDVETKRLEGVANDYVNKTNFALEKSLKALNRELSEALAESAKDSQRIAASELQKSLLIVREAAQNLGSYSTRAWVFGASLCFASSLVAACLVKYFL